MLRAKDTLIIFPDEWISYSPSILNLLYLLEKDERFSPTLLYFDSGKYPIRLDGVVCDKVEIRISRWLIGLLAIFGIHKAYKRWMVRRRVTKRRYTIVIGVDLVGIKAAFGISDNCHYYSLEIERDRFYLSQLFAQVKSIAIQSKERFEYLFSDKNISTHYIQNAPFFDGRGPIKSISEDNIKLVCLGNLIPSHGIYHCVNVLRESENLSVTLAGQLEPNIRKRLIDGNEDLFEAGRLRIVSNYIEQTDVIKYLRNFHIGLCFYDMQRIKKRNEFNYKSSPSGKIFNYMAAGLPVIGSKIIGLAAVEMHMAGLLITDVSPQSIINAVKNITENYTSYSGNAYKAAQEYDFKVAGGNYLDHLYINSESQ